MKARFHLRTRRRAACFLAVTGMFTVGAFAQEPVAQPSEVKADAATPPTAAPSSKTPSANATAIYDPDPQHLWNRLHAAFYRREVEEVGATRRHVFGPAVLDPPLGLHPRFLLDPEPFAQCDAVLAEFLRDRGAERFTDPLKRVVLQRDLWAVFDLLQPENENDGSRNFGDVPTAFTPKQQENRAALSRNLARAIAALALPRAQCERLPDTYPLAVKSGAFPGNPKIAASQEKADYLPADLFAPESPWLEANLGTDAALHAELVDHRSVFRIFYRPPADSIGAANFAAWNLERQKVRTRVEANDPDRPEWAAVRRSVPAGTQFLLLRELIAIDDQWNLVPTRVVESVQVRVFQRESGKKLPASLLPDNLSGFVSQAGQLFEEFELDRASLFRGERGGLHPIAPGSPRLAGYTGLGRLATDLEGRAPGPVPFPFDCAICHTDEKGAAAKPSSPMRIMSLEQAVQLHPAPFEKPAAASTATSKAAHPSFRKLRELAGAAAGQHGR